MRQLDAATWQCRALVAATVVPLLALGAFLEFSPLDTLVDVLSIDGLRLRLGIPLTGVPLPLLLMAVIGGGPLVRYVGRATGDSLPDHGGPVGQHGYLRLGVRVDSA
ncbi:hypothetical protein ATSB10_17070 [Dyella thiooxydans]|uniref:Uncharacterized protein n=1 Tax=Dyella thiooxydans TaxID=445710 RepID=A0A160N075_9GAMM|nr:hypothetical protein [Dyella thiooxydans]AND69161.1 hypothetical protein ATSB10_17070 [Dyella thiooxydans]